jgi:hypothetical protein
MRFPSKKAFVRASLLLIFAIPTLAHAETPEEKTSREAKESADKKSHYISLSEAQAAFGSEFSLEDKSGTFTLYGGTSEDCLGSFDFSNDPKKGQFKILYKGTNDSCLKFETATKDLPKGKFRSLADLPDGKMKPTGTFDLVNLVSDNANSSKSPWTSEELKTDADKSLSNVAAEDVATKKKKALADKKQAEIDRDKDIVKTCNRGLKELDVGDAALARLAKIPEVVKDLGDQYFTDKGEAIRAAKFKACRIQILKAKTDDLAASDCESRLKKIAAADDKYTAKVKALYLELVNRYMNSTTLDMEDAYAASVDTITKLREYDLTDKEAKDVDAAERNVNLHFLRLAAMKGSDSDEFKSMKDHMLEYMLAGDGANCLNEQGVIPMNSAQRYNAACASSQWLSNQLVQQVQLAGSNQLVLNAQATAATAKANADQAKLLNDQYVLACGGLAATASPDGKHTCAAILADDAKAKTDAANVGISTNGFNGLSTGILTTTPATNTTTTPTTGSGFMGSVYTGQKTTTPTVPVNTVQNTTYHLYR